MDILPKYPKPLLNSGVKYDPLSFDSHMLKSSPTLYLLLFQQNQSNGNYIPSIKVDGANGVGAAKLRVMAEAINSGNNLLDVQIVNNCDHQDDVLNLGCGADFVQSQQMFPRNLEEVQPLDRCVSVGKIFINKLSNLLVLVNLATCQYILFAFDIAKELPKKIFSQEYVYPIC